MYPYTLNQLASQHVEDMLAAASGRQPRPYAARRRGLPRADRAHSAGRSRTAGRRHSASWPRTPRRMPIRNRAGWALIAVGLRLAGSSGDS